MELKLKEISLSLITRGEIQEGVLFAGGEYEVKLIVLWPFAKLKPQKNNSKWVTIYCVETKEIVAYNMGEEQKMLENPTNRKRMYISVQGRRNVPQPRNEKFFGKYVDELAKKELIYEE